MILLQSGMTVGEGDVYTYFEPECYTAIMSVLNNPDHELYDLISDPDLARQAFSQLVFSPEYNVWYDPYSSQGGSNEEAWDLLGGEYGDTALEIEMLGDELGVNCGLGAMTIINSHQGTAGF